MTATHSSPSVLHIDGASVLRKRAPILDDLALDVRPGQHTAILGPNGAGKSTLVKLIARQIYPLVKPDGRGQVHIFGENRWNVTQLRALIGIVSPSFQRDYTTDTPLEVFDTVVSGFFAARGLRLDMEATPAMREQAQRALTQVEATHLIGRKMASLSTGEARRVMIARALVHQPRALLLDEPCAGLDLASRRRFLERLRQLARGGTTLLLVTHHIEEILPEVSQVLLLKKGRTYAQGDKDAMLTSAHLSATFGMPIHAERNGDWYRASVAEDALAAADLGLDD